LPTQPRPERRGFLSAAAGRGVTPSGGVKVALRLTNAGVAARIALAHMTGDRVRDNVGMADGAHMTRARYDPEIARLHDLRQLAADQFDRPQRRPAAHQQQWDSQPAIGGERCFLVEDGAKFEAHFDRVARDVGLHFRLGVGKRAGAVPVFVKQFRGQPVGALHDVLAKLQRHGANLAEQTAAFLAQGAQHVKSHRLIERKAGDPVRPLDRDAQRDASAIGVADQMNRPVGGVDDVDDAARLVG